MTIYS